MESKIVVGYNEKKKLDCIDMVNIYRVQCFDEGKRVKINAGRIVWMLTDRIWAIWKKMFYATYEWIQAIPEINHYHSNLSSIFDALYNMFCHIESVCYNLCAWMSEKKRNIYISRDRWMQYIFCASKSSVCCNAMSHTQLLWLHSTGHIY